MLKRVFFDVCIYAGVYFVYSNILNIVTEWRFEFLLDASLVPFFIILAIINLSLKQNKPVDYSKEQSWKLVTKKSSHVSLKLMTLSYFLLYILNMLRVIWTNDDLSIRGGWVWISKYGHGC